MTEQASQQDIPRPDLFEFWRQFYEANEQVWTKVIKDVTITPAYAEAQGKMLETFLAFQKIMREGMTTQLANLNIPSRDDVARLGELITQMEEKIDLLDDRLARVEQRLGVLPGVERTLGRLDKWLSELGERPASVAPITGNGQAHPAEKAVAARAPRPKADGGARKPAAKKTK